MESVASDAITIIGLGNTLAADDGAGARVMALLESGLRSGGPARAARLELASAPGPEWVDLLGEPGEVWIVDAARGEGLKPGEIVHQRLAPGEDAALHAAPHLVSTHGISMAELLRLAQALGRRRATVELWGIVGARFEAGEGLSPEVEQAAAEVARRLLGKLRGAE